MLDIAGVTASTTGRAAPEIGLCSFSEGATLLVVGEDTVGLTPSTTASTTASMTASSADCASAAAAMKATGLFTEVVGVVHECEEPTSADAA